jgi:DNA-directed RNA polymerase subunit L
MMAVDSAVPGSDRTAAMMFARDNIHVPRRSESFMVHSAGPLEVPEDVLFIEDAPGAVASGSGRRTYDLRALTCSTVIGWEMEPCTAPDLGCKLVVALLAAADLPAFPEGELHLIVADDSFVLVVSEHIDRQLRVRAGDVRRDQHIREELLPKDRDVAFALMVCSADGSRTLAADGAESDRLPVCAVDEIVVPWRAIRIEPPRKDGATRVTVECSFNMASPLAQDVLARVGGPREVALTVPGLGIVFGANMKSASSCMQSMQRTTLVFLAAPLRVPGIRRETRYAQGVAEAANERDMRGYLLGLKEDRTTEKSVMLTLNDTNKATSATLRALLDAESNAAWSAHHASRSFAEVWATTTGRTKIRQRVIDAFSAGAGGTREESAYLDLSAAMEEQFTLYLHVDQRFITSGGDKNIARGARAAQQAVPSTADVIVTVDRCMTVQFDSYRIGHPRGEAPEVTMGRVVVDGVEVDRVVVHCARNAVEHLDELLRAFNRGITRKLMGAWGTIPAQLIGFSESGDRVEFVFLGATRSERPSRSEAESSRDHERIYSFIAAEMEKAICGDASPAERSAASPGESARDRRIQRQRRHGDFFFASPFREPKGVLREAFATAARFLVAYKAIRCTGCGFLFATSPAHREEPLVSGQNQRARCVCEGPAVTPAPGQFWVYGDETMDFVLAVDEHTVTTQTVAPTPSGPQQLGRGSFLRRARCVGMLSLGRPVFVGMMVHLRRKPFAVQSLEGGQIHVVSASGRVGLTLEPASVDDLPHACSPDPAWLPWVPGEPPAVFLVAPILCPFCDDGAPLDYNRSRSRAAQNEACDVLAYECARGHELSFKLDKLAPCTRCEKLTLKHSPHSESLAENPRCYECRPAAAPAARGDHVHPVVTGETAPIPPPPAPFAALPTAPSLLDDREDALQRVERLAAKHRDNRLGRALRPFVALLRAAGELPEPMQIGGEALSALLAVDALEHGGPQAVMDRMIDLLAELLEHDFKVEDTRLRMARIAARGDA